MIIIIIIINDKRGIWTVCDVCKNDKFGENSEFGNK